MAWILVLTALPPILPGAAQLLRLPLRLLRGVEVGVAAEAAEAVEAVVAAAEQEHNLGSGTPGSGTACGPLWWPPPLSRNTILVQELCVDLQSESVTLL